MYRPEQFAEDRQDVLAGAMRDIQFAALVTPHAGGIEVTHVPMVVRHEDGRIVLEGHVARPNRHWKIAAEAPGSVAIFQGPQAYVSPSFYPSKQEHGKVVPTWTYITVHAHGRLESVQDGEWLRRHLNDLTEANESSRDAPWKVADAPESYLAGLSRGIVGLRLVVERLEGAWKLNQHKSEPDRMGTAGGLAGSGEAGLRLSQALRALDG